MKEKRPWGTLRKEGASRTLLYPLRLRHFLFVTLDEMLLEGFFHFLRGSVHGECPRRCNRCPKAALACRQSFPCKHENLFAPLLLLSPKSLSTFRGSQRTLFAVFSECRFSVSAPASHRSVVLLVPIGEVVAESYPIRTVIQLSGRLFVLLLINWEIFCDLNEVNFVNFPQTTKRAGTHHIKSAGKNLSLYL